MGQFNFKAKANELWANVLKKFAPEYCAEKKTIKSNPWGQYYLPGSTAELKVFSFLSPEEAKNHYWSLETRVHLLQEGNMTLVRQIETEDELRAVNAEVLSKNVRLGYLIEAMRVRTPSCSLLRFFYKSWTEEVLMLIAAEYPSVFDGLEPWELMECSKSSYEKDECFIGTLNNGKGFKIASKLIRYRAEVWAYPFLKVLASFNEEELGNEYQKVFNQALAAVMANPKISMAKLMENFKKNHPEVLTRIRMRYKDYADFAPYFLQVMPEKMNHLLPNGTKFIWDYAEQPKFVEDQNEDALYWLASGFFCIVRSEDIFRWFRKNYNTLQLKLSERNMEVIHYRLISSAKPEDVAGLYKVSPTRYGRELLIERTGPSHLATYFPFADWEEDLRQAACARLVKCGAFPVERLMELSEQEQNAVLYRMKVRSQIQLLNTKDRLETLPKLKLLPEAEVYLLHNGSSKEINLYLDNRKGMSEQAYLALINGVNISRRENRMSDINAESFLWKKIHGWGITKKEYLQLLQSQLSSVAPLVEPFVK